ncbi:unnamed protein product [Strongylus vulgaris]|uniref:Uncharacterized protein n=1 Tax=Strongylus vulgaris TaxID=40348 RepID=A0A3P7JS11_STRVU|nr:unnamed protein product [Strongylus vulgaris]
MDVGNLKFLVRESISDLYAALRQSLYIRGTFVSFTKSLRTIPSAADRIAPWIASQVESLRKQVTLILSYKRFAFVSYKMCKLRLTIDRCFLSTITAFDAPKVGLRRNWVGITQ